MAKRNLAATYEIVDEHKKLPITVSETESFIRESRKIFTEVEIEELITHAAQFRELGSVIRETAGVRKLRWATDNNKGKSHGSRIIYYYGGDHMPVYLIACYAKNKKVTLSSAEKKAVRKFVEALKKCHEPQRRRQSLKLLQGKRNE